MTPRRLEARDSRLGEELSRLFLKPQASSLKPLSLLPPDPDAVAEEQERHDQQSEPEHHAALIGRHRHGPVLRILWTDRDEVLLLCEPVLHVEKQLAIALEANRT